MRRLRPFDTVLLTILVPLWGICFALYAKETISGRLARVSVFVSTPEREDAYPILLGFWPGSPQAEESGLAVGDQLVRLGDMDLRGVGSLIFLAQAYEQAKGRMSVPISFIRAGKPGEAQLGFDPFAFPWSVIPVTLGYAVTAAFAFVRMPRSRPARAYFLAGMSYSIHWSPFLGGSSIQTYMWVGVYFLSSLVILPFALYAVLVLPEETAPRSKIMLVWPWIFALRGPTAISWYFGYPLPHEVGMQATNVIEAIFVAALLAVITRNYRLAGPLGRRQIKWVLYGLYVGVMPILFTASVAFFRPHLWQLQEVGMGFMLFTPICIAVAIVRFNLFDVDRLISATAAYSILLIALAVGGLIFVPTLSQASNAVIGIPTAAGQVAFAMLLSVGLFWTHRPLRSYIDQLFFPERYALQQGVNTVLQALPSHHESYTVFMLVGDQLDKALRPESCVIYAQDGATYAPVFVRGSIVPPTLEVRSLLAGALQTRGAFADEEEWRRTARTYLRPSERVVLDRLRAAMVLPFDRRQPPNAFLCLGPKRSGDIYTATDTALLTTIVESVSAALQRFEQTQTLSQIAVRADTD